MLVVLQLSSIGILGQKLFGAGKEAANHWKFCPKHSAFLEASTEYGRHSHLPFQSRAPSFLLPDSYSDFVPVHLRSVPWNSLLRTGLSQRHSPFSDGLTVAKCPSSPCGSLRGGGLLAKVGLIQGCIGENAVRFFVKSELLQPFCAHRTEVTVSCTLGPWYYPWATEWTTPGSHCASGFLALKLKDKSVEATFNKVFKGTQVAQ